MPDALILIAGIGIGLALGCIGILIVNDSWHRLALKQNSEWAEFSKRQNKEWLAIALGLPPATPEGNKE